MRDASGEPVVWAVELRAASQVAQDGVTVDAFPPGTIFSIGLHPLRNGRPAGGRGKSGLFKCPPNTPPTRRQELRQRHGIDVARAGRFAATDGRVETVNA